MNNDEFDLAKRIYKKVTLPINKALLDNYLFELFTSWQRSKFDDFIDHIRIDGLNSQENRQQTNLLLIPKYQCIWLGKNTEKNHDTTCNLLLSHCIAVPLRNGLIKGKYSICCTLMDKSIYGNHCGREYLHVGLSPITENIDLNTHLSKNTKSIKDISVNVFSVNDFRTDEENEIFSYICEVLKKASIKQIEILVFPEMLGNRNILSKTRSFLENNNFNYPKIIVFPSIWEKGEEYNRNYNCVINYEGTVLFEQDKLRRFSLDNNCIEDIREGKVINILHIEGYGNIGVLICRSELDNEIRHILIHTLGVKLILCSSWTPGVSYEFATSIMAGAVYGCNTVWCNSCSALRDKQFIKKEIGIISPYGKNKIYSHTTLDDYTFPKENCSHNCESGCIYDDKIFGIDYRVEKNE